MVKTKTTRNRKLERAEFMRNNRKKNSLTKIADSSSESGEVFTPVDSDRDLECRTMTKHTGNYPSRRQRTENLRGQQKRKMTLTKYEDSSSESYEDPDDA